MRIKTNHIYSIINFYKSELVDIYNDNEINSFVALSMEKLLGYSKVQLLLNKNQTVSESMLLKFNWIVKDLKHQKPIQYILGETEFYGHIFKVTESVLIPRPETEELVHWIITDYKDQNNITLLDIGTGSGCIPITLKKHLNANVSSWDISADAIAIAKENATINEVSINIEQHDILNVNTQEYKVKFDVIVSNPPYVCETEKSMMSDNVLKHEPSLALFVDDADPLLFYRSILKAAQTMLKPNGVIYFEINERFGEEMNKLALELGYTKVELRKDLNGKDRMMKFAR